MGLEIIDFQWDTPFEPDAGHAAVGNAAFTAPYVFLIFKKSASIVLIHAAFFGAYSERDW